MSIRLKFSVVLALLALTLVINVVLSVWSIRFLERELARPLRSAQPVLAALHRVKRIGEHEAVDLGIGRSGQTGTSSNQRAKPDPKDVGKLIINSEILVGQELERLNNLPTVLVRSGVSTTKNITDRSSEILSIAQSWARDGSPEDFELLVERVEMRHELIERVEGRILQDAELATNYGEKLNFVVLSIISISVAGALASAFYAAVLLRRWIIEPIGLLREGARRLGHGEFDHRIEIATGDELGQLGEEFNTMSTLIMAMQDDRIEHERMAAVGEMAQRTVHNLRTPLAGIRALAETTMRELDPDSDLHAIQDRILTTVDRFEHWLQGMLRVSAPLELHHSKYQPSQLVDNVVTSHQDAAKAQGVDIVVLEDDIPAEAFGDPHHLEHAFTAILSNTIDFSPNGSQIEIELGREGDYWTARIIDHGPGIDPDLQVSIFRPYFTTRQSGTGIGLAMVKRIIEQHQGTVAVESPFDPVSLSGTAFIVKILLNVKTGL